MTDDKRGVIDDFVTIDITGNIEHPKRGEFERGWISGFYGQPVPDGSSEWYRDAHAMGAVRAVENSQWELKRLAEDLAVLRRNETDPGEVGTT